MSDNQEKLNEQLFNVIKNDKDSDEARLKKVKYLVRLGADVNTRLYGKSVLSKALELQDEEVISFLKSKGANEWVIPKEEALEVSQGFWDGWSNLKSIEEIKELLKKGADLEAKDENGKTALIRAAKRGDIEGVKSLVECGADLEVKDEYGETVLMMEARWGHLEMVKYLIDNGADLEAKDKLGITALMEAASWGKLDVVKYLAQNGVDVEAKDGDGRTALMWAASRGELDVVKYLAQNGADLDVKDGEGRTVLDIAKNEKRDYCVKFLEEYQKKVSAQKNKGDKTGVSLIVKKNEGRD